MHQQNLEVQIGQEQDCDLQIPIPKQSIPSENFSKINLQIKIPSPDSSTNQIHIINEPFCQNQSPNKTLLSTPHKRPIMSQNSNLNHSPTHQSHFKVPILKSNNSSKNQSFLCPCSVPVLVATKRITLKLIHHSCHVSWIRVHLKLFILLSLPSLYLLTSTHSWGSFLYFLFIITAIIIAFFVISLCVALPCVPSIRTFLARTLSFNLHSSPTASKSRPSVVWSIGSKPKPERKPISGCWVQVYSNGDVYEGEFHKGKCSGSGVYYYRLSGRYEGDWIDGKYDGYGVETWTKGSRYRGQYRQGLRHGVGMYRSYTGDLYAGEWCNGQCHGSGVHTCEDGSSYTGEFKWGIKHGLGRYHFRNGDAYAGEYFADKMHGFGVYHFGNGHRYEGAWHEGKRQGFGIYTFRTGETQSGHWQNGILNVSTSLGALPGSPSAVDHSKVLHAVQEARQASEKAINVTKVDERVKRAVTAANKSATAARVAAVKAVQNQIHHNRDSCHSPLAVV
ncbi:uncharacterized protein LOC107806603 [Nicotiana tabacum]|uniref:Uncharacterized protein LOC107806603 n=1 Tax=Nicotiana tabacum TaxID=4097 RepID=A0A1S4BBN1_TOBAC|nr:uncharacterized protein LOC104096313 [Nicotiana tomentosiformis]XP_016486277.1 PREDICTED: uncharacterized protein LOC107806603 [Nicotiana tabacum]